MNPVLRLAALARKPSRLVLGLMSGMSMDGLDLALVRVRGRAPGLRVRLLASHTAPYGPALRARLRAATRGSVVEGCRLSYDLAERWAGDVRRFLERARVPASRVDLLGSHGQTLVHVPRAAGEGRARTWQVGEGDVLAERTGLLTVSDFRPRDVAAGGEGAPLIPFADWCLWSRRGEVSAALNLGSIANVTVVTPDPTQVLAFDLGPANALIDGLARACPGRHGGIDRDGRLSARGRVHVGLLGELFACRRAFLDAPPPKSAGFADFGPDLAARLARDFRRVAPHDRVRTAVEFTAAAVGQALARFVLPRFPALRRVRVSGGGTRNPTLMAALRAHVQPLGVRVTPLSAAWSNAKEAVGFALLADATVRGQPNSLPGATGARRAVVLGKLSLA